MSHPSRHPAHRRLVVVAALAAGAVPAALPAAVAATDGNLYPYGSSIWATGSQFSASVLAGPVFQISSPALALAETGSKFEMNWGCPVAGSEIAAVRWSALRHAAPSSLAQEVFVNGGLVWISPDSAMPQSPSGGSPFEAGLPAGACNVHLRLVQTEARAQHARTYWIGDPRIVVRDVWSPGAGFTSVTGGWIPAARNDVQVGWAASDNFGSDGIGAQHLWVAGLHKWSGSPGQGGFSLGLDLNGVGDGAQNVHLQVDGDGTGPGAADATIYVDRTAPTAWDLGAAYSGAPGRADLVWTAGDNLSDVARSDAQLNAATDGSTGGAWVTVASGPAGGGVRRAPGTVTSVVPDGRHAFRVVVTDGAGNTGSGAGGVVVVDTTAPTVALAPLPSGWVGRLPLDVTLHDNLEDALGLGATDVQVNTAADGSASGTWLTLSSAARAAGRHVEDLALPGLADGSHMIRVLTRNGGAFGTALIGQAAGTLRTDLTAPALSGVGFRGDGPAGVVVSWVADDPLSGVAHAAVQWLDRGTWRTLAEAGAGSGAGEIPASTADLPEGTVHLRLIVTDAAGNAAVAEVPWGTAQVDRTPPSITGLALSGGPGSWRLQWTQADEGSGLGTCPGRIEVSGPGTDDWKEIVTVTAGAGPQSAALPVDGMDPGAYRVRLVVCDSAGNSARAETAGLVVPARAAETVIVAGADGLGSPGSGTDAFAHLRSARLILRVAGARIERFGGRAYWVRSLRFGDRVTVRGRLLAASGAPLARTEIHARGYKNRLLGRTRTGRDGTFRLALRPEAGGVLRIGAPAGDALLPTRVNAGVRVRVRPLVTFRSSSRVAVAYGAPVVFSGRLRPSPALIGGEPRKSIILEWLDPLRRVWRPVLNARVRRDGGYRFVWRFQARGLDIPMRVRVPVERGWPLDAALTPVVRVRVR